MALRTTLRLAGSSPRRVALTLERLGWAEFAQAARGVRSCAKTSALATLLKRPRRLGGKGHRLHVVPGDARAAR